MTKPKIKFKLVKFEKALVFQVLEMDERFRAKVVRSSIDENFHKAKNGFLISSGLYQNIGYPHKEVALRGNSFDEDYMLSIKSFESNIERDEYYDKIIEALKDWAENWEGWKEQEKQQSEPDVFVF